MPMDVKSPPKTAREADVTGILKLMAGTLKNMRTYHGDNPVLKKSFSMLFESLNSFLRQNESLTLLVREDELMFGHHLVYASTDRMESLAFALYKDGIRLISFRNGLTIGELGDFLTAIHEAREADPYQADVVTILWEKDLVNISYRAVDAYLEGDERQSIEQMAMKSGRQAAPPGQGTTLPGSEFFIKELGLSPGEQSLSEPAQKLQASESESRSIVREILEEDDKSILRRCSDVCLEVIKGTPRDDTFNRVVDFLGRICDWLVSSGDFLSACSILSDLRSLSAQNDLPQARKSSIMDTIGKRSERRKIQQIEAHLYSQSDLQIEEIFAYLALMSPTAVAPLCEMLAESEVRKVRYLLCRAISILGRTELERLRLYVQDERWFFVRNIVMILGMMASPQAVPILKSVVSHPEPRVRREVARSLGRIRDASGLEVLRVLITDANKLVRIAAMAATKDIGGPGARQMLEDLINDRSFSKKTMDEKT
ncbi:MAG TPA: HEAT repeat domain-containing protein, partial [bacterium]|nr:HEAT repeat domain-containing protein [bacterium]